MRRSHVPSLVAVGGSDSHAASAGRAKEEGAARGREGRRPNTTREGRAGGVGGGAGEGAEDGRGAPAPSRPDFCAAFHDHSPCNLSIHSTGSPTPAARTVWLTHAREEREAGERKVEIRMMAGAGRRSNAAAGTDAADKAAAATALSASSACAPCPSPLSCCSGPPSPPHSLDSVGACRDHRMRGAGGAAEPAGRSRASTGSDHPS